MSVRELRNECELSQLLTWFEVECVNAHVFACLWSMQAAVFFMTSLSFSDPGSQDKLVNGSL